jgi:putative PIN family toxin of toxin-antitoxin system
VLVAARKGSLQLFTSAVLLVELEDVLGREKLAKRLSLVNVSAIELVVGYASLATPVTPLAIEAVVLDDPDDDAVLACALAAHADVIVSGDRHLLSLKNYEGMSILTAPELIAQITEE